MEDVCRFSRQLSECARVLASLLRAAREGTRHYRCYASNYFHKYYGAAKPISIGAFELSRIHDHGLVRLHIARAFSGFTCSTASEISYDFLGLTIRLAATAWQANEAAEVGEPRITRMSRNDE
jgi:hypothetical protein